MHACCCRSKISTSVDTILLTFVLGDSFQVRAQNRSFGFFCLLQTNEYTRSPEICSRYQDIQSSHKMRMDKQLDKLRALDDFEGSGTPNVQNPVREPKHRQGIQHREWTIKDGLVGDGSQTWGRINFDVSRVCRFAAAKFCRGTPN